VEFRLQLRLGLSCVITIFVEFVEYVQTEQHDFYISHSILWSRFLNNNCIPCVASVAVHNIQWKHDMLWIVMEICQGKHDSTSFGTQHIYILILVI